MLPWLQPPAPFRSHIRRVEKWFVRSPRGIDREDRGCGHLYVKLVRRRQDALDAGIRESSVEPEATGRRR